jgi:MoxR-like ATPase
MPHALSALQRHVESRIIGQPVLVERLLIGLLANGHLLVESLPGLAKTRAIKALASGLEAQLSRVQFTPDLLPSDITGSEMFYQNATGGEFRFAHGPVFTNLLLADEINRAPAKVQAALLEAMEERQVTVAGTSHPLPDVFLVMATQNPIEQEGTYPLPEAQLDRFLMHVRISYPSPDDELRVLRLVRDETQQAAPDSPQISAGETAMSGRSPASNTVCDLATITTARREVQGIHASPAIDQYIVNLIHTTRHPAQCSPELASWLSFGASPRGTLALDRCARAHAWLAGRDFITPDDVRAIAHDALRHRLVLSYEAHAAGVTAERVIDEIIRHVTAL